MMRLGALVAFVTLPVMAAAQVDSARMHVDTTRARHERTSAGAIARSPSHNRGLTADQTKQLQTALRQANCDPGAVDGVWGLRTDQAMGCVRQKNNISGHNPNDVFRSLNLGFTTSDSLGVHGARVMTRERTTPLRRPMPDTARHPARGTLLHPPIRDTLRKPPTTRKDTTPRR